MKEEEITRELQIEFLETMIDFGEAYRLTERGVEIAKSILDVIKNLE